MLRGIFLMSRPPLLREGGDFATLQVNPLKNEAAVRQHVQNAQPAWVLARRGCAFWTGLPTQGKFIRTRKSSLQTSKLQGGHRPPLQSRVTYCSRFSSRISIGVFSGRLMSRPRPKKFAYKE